MVEQLEGTPGAESRKSFFSKLFCGKESDLTDGFQKYQHISYDIEAQERLLRQHVLATNLVQKDTAAGGAAGKAIGENEEGDLIDDPLIGNIYKFQHNRNFYDSLDSIEIYRNEEPEYMPQTNQANGDGYNQQ